MTAIFTNTFRAALAADATLVDAATVQMVAFPVAASLRPDQEVDDSAPIANSPYATVDTIAGLEAMLGWGPSVTQRASSTLGTHGTAGSTNYAPVDSIGFVWPAGFPTSMVKVVAFVYTGPKPAMVNKVMFITDTPTDTGTLMGVGDGVIPQADPAKGRMLLSWAADSVIEGPLVRTVGPKTFEAARTQHLWCYAQRMNMIANPSFEEDTDYWRSDGAKSQIQLQYPSVHAATRENLPALSGLLTIDGVVLVAGNRVLVKDQTAAQNNGVYVVAAGAWTRASDADTGAKLVSLVLYVRKGTTLTGTAWAAVEDEILLSTTPITYEEVEIPMGGGNFAGRFAGKVVESNMFPRVTRLNEEGWTFQMLVRSDGEVKVGFIAWGPDFMATSTDWGHPEEVWLPNNGWLHVRTCRDIGETSTGMLRVETQGTYIELDQVCVEFGTMPANYGDWPYFDGASLYGTAGDYSWYERPHKSYSCWYNDRTAAFGRLFSWSMSPEDAAPGGIFTDEEAAKQGLAHQWVPAGTPLLYHTDILYPNDPKNALPPVTGLVLVRGTGAQQVATPWIAREAYAGTPGTWGPAAWTAPAPSPPADFTALRNGKVSAYPLSRWTTGQYVQTATSGASGRGHWSGTNWEQGPAQ